MDPTYLLGLALLGALMGAAGFIFALLARREHATHERALEGKRHAS